MTPTITSAWAFQSNFQQHFLERGSSQGIYGSSNQFICNFADLNLMYWFDKFALHTLIQFNRLTTDRLTCEIESGNIIFFYFWGKQRIRLTNDTIQHFFPKSCNSKNTLAKQKIKPLIQSEICLRFLYILKAINFLIKDNPACEY